MSKTPADTSARIITETIPAAPKRSQAQTVRSAFLVHIYPTGPAMGTRYSLAQEALVLGRAPECAICVDEESVSRQHVRIEATETGFYAEDLESRNGTFVNDTRITSARLRDGDTLYVGNCIFRFLSGDNAETAYHEEIYRLTISDALTGIANKRRFQEVLERELKRALRHQRPLALVLFDIDRFKAINDTRGHLCGDATLRELVNRLKDQVRDEDLLARYGGEEFGLVLVETSHLEARETAERLRQRIEERPFVYDGQEFSVTISLGVASTSGRENWTAAELIQQADDKLYQAKGTGRNCVMA